MYSYCQALCIAWSWEKSSHGTPMRSAITRKGKGKAKSTSLAQASTVRTSHALFGGRCALR